MNLASVDAKDSTVSVTTTTALPAKKSYFYALAIRNDLQTIS